MVLGSIPKIENKDIRDALRRALGHVDLRSIAFGIAHELRKRVETQEILGTSGGENIRLKEFLSSLLSQARSDPEYVGSVRSEVKTAFGLTVPANREISAFFYDRVIRPED